jgi:hypothetical protein
MSIRSTNPVCHWSTAFASLLCPGSVPVAAVKAPCPERDPRSGSTPVARGRQHVGWTRAAGTHPLHARRERRSEPMNATPALPIVTIQFGNLETFCDELATRGPNIEPVVRICQQVHRGQSDTHGPLPIEHVFGHVSYLRRTADVLQMRSCTCTSGSAGRTPTRRLTVPRSRCAWIRCTTACASDVRPSGTRWLTAAPTCNPEHSRERAVRVAVSSAPQARGLLTECCGRAGRTKHRPGRPPE